MARKIPAALTSDMIVVAELLAKQRGTPNLRQAAMRRAVSSAYYAVFHALAFVCADCLVGWAKTDILPRIYRSLDHSMTRSKLNSQDARSIDPTLAQVGVLFRQLQELRHEADYAPPRALFHRTQFLALIDDARDAIALIDALDEKSRLQLAVLLVSRQR